MLNDTVFFKSKKKINITLTFMFIFFRSTSLYPIDQTLDTNKPLKKIGTMHTELLLDTSMFDNLKNSVDNLGKTIETATSQDLPRLMSFTAIMTGSFGFFTLGGLIINNEMQKNEIRKPRIVAGAGFMTAGFFTLIYSRQLNNFIHS